MVGNKVIRIAIIIACLGLVGAAQAELIGYWSFDEGAGTVANDGSGNDNHGEVVGDAQWVAGKVGGALAFDGSDDMVVVEQNHGLPIYNNGTDNVWSIAMWVKGGPQNDMRIFSEASTSNNNPLFNLGTKNDGATGQLDCYIRPAGMGHTFSDAEPFDDTWHHIAWVDEDGAARLYVDGVLDGGDFNYTRAELDLNTTTIGGILRGNPSHWFTGMIDDVQIYNHALTEAEVLAAMDGLAPKALAKNPAPDDEAVDVARESVLSWNAGKYAAEHDVYLGTSFADVNDATTADAAYVGRQAETQYAPETLVLGTAYYWRIDEVNAAPDSTVFKGKTWSFELEPVSYPVPVGAVSATASSTTEGQDPNNTVNGSGLNESSEHTNLQEDMWLGTDTDLTPVITFELAQVEKLDKVRVWNHNTQTEAILGFGIKEALIEYSTDGESWSELGTVELAQATGTNDYTGTDVPLEGIVAGYVKITGLSNFSILGLPQMGLSEVRFYAVPMRARLEVPASGSTDQDPLVELSWRAGREAAQHDVLVGTDPAALTLLATTDDAAYTAALDLDSILYWQVNEVNNAMDPSVWEGHLWEIETAEYITVDDMESYKSREGSYVWETWVDGFDDDTNGALLGHNGDDMESDTFYDGAQSLPYFYGQGAAANSEASRDIERDWGQHGIVSLSLMFYGSESNVAGELYIKVNDTEIATYPVSSDLMIPQWQAWTIDLPASALGDVKSLAIGIKGGTGVIFIDAIRLYSRASETVVGVAPDDTDLVAHYSFEGNASDVTGNGHDGTLEGGPQFVTGKVGQALDFDGVDDVVSTGKVASQLGIGGNNPRTVSSWVYTRGYANGGIYDVGARASGEDFSLRTLSDIVDRWRIQYWGGDFDFTFNTLDRWVNFVHVHDGTHTKIYADGRLIVDWEKTINTTDTNPFQIGLYGWPGNFFYGVIDEVRVYSRPLSQEEALGLAGRTEPIFKEF